MSSISFSNRVPLKKISVTLSSVPLPLPIHGLIGFIVLYIVFDWGRKVFNFLLTTETTTKECSSKFLDDQDSELPAKMANVDVMNREDMEMVFDRLGIFSPGNQIQERVDSGDLLRMFGEDEDEAEAAIDEVRAAFDVFDENRDGFIDEWELKRVLCSLGLMSKGSDGDEDLISSCRAMIMAFDEDGDGKIDFHEFSALF